MSEYWIYMEEAQNHVKMGMKESFLNVLIRDGKVPILK